jgi:predicted transcriptional regulator
VTTLRLSDEELRRIDSIARKQGVDRSVILRKAIAGGLREVQMEEAVARYQRGECSAWRAATDAGLGLWEFLDELRGRGVLFRTDERHLEDLIEGPG